VEVLESAVIELTSSLKINRCLKHLNLSNCGVGSRGIVALGNMLSQNGSITSVN
jgi:hypothetical protein